jgi:hypothetical protein
VDEEPAAERRAGDRADSAAQRKEGRYRGQLFGRDELLIQRVERGPVKCVRRLHDKGKDKYGGHARPREERIAREPRDAEAKHHLGEQEEPAAIEGVGHRSAPEAENEQRDELHGADKPDQHRRAR